MAAYRADVYQIAPWSVLLRSYLDRAILYEVAAIHRGTLSCYGLPLPELYRRERPSQPRCRLLVQGLL